MTNPHASALGKLSAGIPKQFSAKELKRRTARLLAAAAASRRRKRKDALNAKSKPTKASPAAGLTPKGQ